MLGGTAFIDLRRDDEVLASACERLRQIVGAERTEVAAARPRLRRLCILIVGHDVDNAHRIGDVLEDIGHDVDYAYDGAPGVDAARRLRPDVVFVAMDLPGLDAYQLARRLRGEPGLHGALIIALTGAASEENLRRMREAGFDHHLAKWVDRRSLQNALDRLLAQRSP
jgi:CheY-like chemotaxis protein